MKKIVLAGVVMVFAMVAGNASAANSMAKGNLGINVNTTDNFIINGKYFIEKDMAVLGGLGLRIAGGDAKGTDIGFLAGVRKYLKPEDFAPFVGARFEYSSINDSNNTNLALIAEAGAEYFVAKQFSIEARVGFGYQSVDNKTTIPYTKSTYIGTSVGAISANFYF